MWYDSYMTDHEYRVTYVNLKYLAEEDSRELTKPAGEGWELVSITPVNGFNVIFAVAAWQRPRLKAG
jgi:Domain of unknown function (DUF4177)